MQGISVAVKHKIKSAHVNYLIVCDLRYLNSIAVATIPRSSMAPIVDILVVTTKF
jgi:hypothetical protein